MFVLSSGLIRSTDNGKSWKNITPSFRVNYIVIDRNDNIYANSYSGIISKSTDDGNSWDSLFFINGNNPSIFSIVIAPDSAIYVTVRTSNSNLFLLRTSNGGKTWDSLNNIPGYVWGQTSIDSSGVLLIASETFVCRSTNKGETWTKDTNGIIPSFYTYVTCGKKAIFLADDGYEFAERSSDDGKTWSQLPLKRGAFAINNKGRVLYAGNGIVRYSDDNGNSWNDFGGLGPWKIDGANPYFICTDADSGFFFQMNGILFHANVPGVSPWSPISLPTSTVSALIFTPDGNILAGGYPSISKDTGRTWVPIADTIVNPFANWYITDSNRNIIGGTNADLFRSTNSGKTWHTIPNPAAGLLTKCLVHQSGVIFLGTESYGLFSSKDGLSWNHVDSLPEKVIFSIVVNGSGVLFCATMNGNYISRNNGLDWSRDSTHNMPSISLASDLYNDSYLTDDYVGEMERSYDNGRTWHPFIKGLESAYVVNGLITTPDGTVFAFTDNGIFKHSFGDCLWTSFSEGLSTKGVLSMTYDREGRLFAGSSGGGVFKSTKTFNHIPFLTGRLLAANLDFGNATVGDTICQNLTITNVGLAPIILTKDFIIADPAPFSVASAFLFPIILQPNDSVHISVCFHPPQPAVYTSEINWAANVRDTACILAKPQSILHGIAFPKADVKTSPNSLTFSIHPNPLHAKGEINFSLEKKSYMRIDCLDILGRSLKILADGNFDEGDHTLTCDLSDLADGVYVIRMATPESEQTEDVVIYH